MAWFYPASDIIVHDLVVSSRTLHCSHSRMAKKSSQQGVGKDAAPPKPKKPNPSRPRKKAPKSQNSNKPQEPLQPEAPPSTAATAPPVKATKRTRKSKIETQTCFMYPSLHEDIVDAVSPFISDPWFQEEDTDHDRINYYETNVMGKFHCRNFACPTQGWGSKKVAIVIKGYSDNGYNAVVYNQNCEACKNLGTLKLNNKSYVERVSYRLMKWAGVDVQPPVFGKKRTDPHREDLCEGCKKGVCPAGEASRSSVMRRE